MGPFLILAGMALTGLLPLPVNIHAGSDETLKQISRWGHLGEFLVGMIFALSFCPVSAGLFFGSLIPMSLSSKIPVFLFIAYGFGTALPVGLIAILIAVSLEKASAIIGKIQAWQKALTTNHRSFTYPFGPLLHNR